MSSPADPDRSPAGNPNQQVVTFDDPMPRYRTSAYNPRLAAYVTDHDDSDSQDSSDSIYPRDFPEDSDTQSPDDGSWSNTSTLYGGTDHSPERNVNLLRVQMMLANVAREAEEKIAQRGRKRKFSVSFAAHFFATLSFEEIDGLTSAGGKMMN